jgi:hypothetical protein
VGPNFTLARVPDHINPLQLTNYAMMQFVASPLCVAEFVSSRHLLEKAELYKCAIFPLLPQMMNLELTKSPILFENHGYPVGFPRTRALLWSEVIDNASDIDWIKNRYKVDDEIPPGN